MKNCGFILLIIISESCVVSAQADTNIANAKQNVIPLPDTNIFVAMDTVGPETPMQIDFPDSLLWATGDSSPVKKDSVEVTTHKRKKRNSNTFDWTPSVTFAISPVNPAWYPWSVSFSASPSCWLIVTPLPPPVRSFEDLLNPPKKRQGVLSRIRHTNPNNLSRENANKKPVAPPIPLLPEAPWYQAILPDPIRLRKF